MYWIKAPWVGDVRPAATPGLAGDSLGGERGLPEEDELFRLNCDARSRDEDDDEDLDEDLDDADDDEDEDYDDDDLDEDFDDDDDEDFDDDYEDDVYVDDDDE